MLLLLLMPSYTDGKKRAFVSLLKKLARKYNLQVDIVRESSDVQVMAAFRKVLLNRKYIAQALA